MNTSSSEADALRASIRTILRSHLASTVRDRSDEDKAASESRITSFTADASYGQLRNILEALSGTRRHACISLFMDGENHHTVSEYMYFLPKLAGTPVEEAIQHLRALRGYDHLPEHLDFSQSDDFTRNQCVALLRLAATH